MDVNNEPPFNTYRVDDSEAADESLVSQSHQESSLQSPIIWAMDRESANDIESSNSDDDRKLQKWRRLGGEEQPPASKVEDEDSSLSSKAAPDRTFIFSSTNFDSLTRFFAVSLLVLIVALYLNYPSRAECHPNLSILSSAHPELSQVLSFWRPDKPLLLHIASSDQTSLQRAIQTIQLIFKPKIQSEINMNETVPPLELGRICSDNEQLYSANGCVRVLVLLNATDGVIPSTRRIFESAVDDSIPTIKYGDKILHTNDWMFVIVEKLAVEKHKLYSRSPQSILTDAKAKWTNRFYLRCKNTILV